jgi:hypothetical protein
LFEEQGFEGAADCLDFRQFWHTQGRFFEAADVA